MTVYPLAIDSDATITRVDDNITEVGGDAINQNRAATFAIENELGVGPSGSAGTVANRLNASLNPDGTIKASALTSVGLATLPIVDAQVAFNAGIKEYKLALDFSTSDLHTLILSNTALLNSLTSFTNTIFSDLNAHIAGAQLLADGSKARHVLSQIDLNAVPSDARDPSFVWTGLKDKDGAARSAVTAGQALDQINTDLINHENSTNAAHHASAITVDSSGFIEIPTTATDAQAVFDALDIFEISNIGLHRAVQHSQGISKTSRSQDLQLPDGYRENVVPPTPVQTYLVHSPSVSPVDDLSTGDDIIRFVPANPTSTFAFDSQFSQVRVGDTVRVNYANGIESMFLVESIRYVPGTEWIVRINGTNLCDVDGYAEARIDRSPHDTNTVGVLAVAAANPTPTGSFSTILSSVIVGNPRGATALGLGFDPGKLDADHYKLYLHLYPTGNPADRVIQLPFIDVTGDAGASPGLYTLESVIQATNDNLRQIGYNYRFIAFAHDGEFGIMLADAINNVSFSIVSGSNSSGTLATGAFTENVIGGSTLDDFDALGFGSLAANLASPVYQSTFLDATAAQLPTVVIPPLKGRDYYVNGQRRNLFAPTYLSNDDGSWDGYISARNAVGIFTVETTYTINLSLSPAGLRPGKTLVVQPTVNFTDPLYSDVDYGRFIIKNINFIAPCGSAGAMTQITVINGITTTGNGFGFSSVPPLAVKIFFSEDSVSFNNEEIIDQSPTTLQFHRLHEIYIDNTGNTFSHERGRMPRQVEDSSPSFLGTDRLTLKNVSSKLRGYRDSSPIVFNKFVRLYILSYDSTTGEFDGYLGKRAGATSVNILQTGPVSTGRKNVPVRFYDETGIDFIEVQFTDGVSPGTSVLSTALPRFVDIELFPSLQLDDELLLLATCEVNWTPAANKDVVQFVTDARQFGSIGEKDFTNSALDFISSSDRFLHDNGIFRGLNFDSVNSTDNRELFFKGGVAIVNGKVVTANNQSVTIPRVYPNGSSLPQDVKWAVCLNENGELTSILITAAKQQYFATNGTTNYYLPSVTFSELVITRKDLLPIALVTAHVASFTISSSDILDVRRFVENVGLNDALIWSSEEHYGHFTNFNALKAYIQNFGDINNKVVVKGNFTVDSSIDFSGFSSKVIFEGAGSTININAAKGFLIDSNVTLKNLNFNYVPPNLGLSNTNLVNRGNGCLFSASGSNRSNIAIEDCTFSCTTSANARPPFICLEMQPGDVIRELSIARNKFSDVNTSNQAAIVIYDINTNGGTNAAVLMNTRVEYNRCDGTQSIIVSSLGLSFLGDFFSRPGLRTIDTSIQHNYCGQIGFCTSSVQSTSSFIDGYASSVGLVINDNTAFHIGTVDGLFGYPAGSMTFTTTDFGTGDVTIQNNKAHWINVCVANSATHTERGVLKILNNSLDGYDSTYASARYFLNNIAINVTDSSNTNTDYGQVIIANNVIDKGISGSAQYLYSTGIQASQSCNITNNIIRGLIDNGLTSTGITITSAGSVERPTIISHNKIYRGTSEILNYIDLSALSTSDSSGFVTENWFDSVTLDNFILLTTVTGPKNWIIDRNHNQHITVEIEGNLGFSSVSDTVGGAFHGHGAVFTGGTAYTAPTWNGLNGTAPDDTQQMIWHFDSTGRSYIWDIPLQGTVPYGANVVGLVVTGDRVGSAFSSASTTTVNIVNAIWAGASGSFSWNTGTASHTYSISPTYGQAQMIPGPGNKYPKVQILATTAADTGNGSIFWHSIFVTYRW